MSKSVSKKPRPSVAERKYLECEIAITLWENYSRRCGVTPRRIVDELDWLYKWHPEYRARLNDLYDRMAKLFETNTFDYFDYEPWEI